MANTFYSIKLLVFVLWSCNFIFLSNVVESRVLYGGMYNTFFRAYVHRNHQLNGTLFGAYFHPNQFDLTMEDMNEGADVRKPLNFDGKLDSKYHFSQKACFLIFFEGKNIDHTVCRCI